METVFAICNKENRVLHVFGFLEKKSELREKGRTIPKMTLKHQVTWNSYSCVVPWAALTAPKWTHSDSLGLVLFRCTYVMAKWHTSHCCCRASATLSATESQAVPPMTCRAEPLESQNSLPHSLSYCAGRSTSLNENCTRLGRRPQMSCGRVKCHSS